MKPERTSSNFYCGMAQSFLCIVNRSISCDLIHWVNYLKKCQHAIGLYFSLSPPMCTISIVCFDGSSMHVIMHILKKNKVEFYTAFGFCCMN